MEFKAISAERGETRVDAVPSSPDGFFRISYDPMFRPFAVGAIVLHEVKPRHVRALQRGNAEPMNRYVVTDPRQPDVISFTKCSPGVPDPLQPTGTLVRVRQAKEVHMDKTIVDEHRAVGNWWAQRLLRPVIDTGDRSPDRPELPESVYDKLLTRAGDYALILAGLSRTRNIPLIRVDYHPDAILAEAADLAGVPTVVSVKSYTHITEDGLVTAREGRSGEVTQIWPPSPEPA